MISSAGMFTEKIYANNEEKSQKVHFKLLLVNIPTRISNSRSYIHPVGNQKHIICYPAISQNSSGHGQFENKREGMKSKLNN